MIYKTYLRWPNHVTSNKTTTHSLAVAQFAYCELLKIHAGKLVGASLTSRETGAKRAKNLQYAELNKPNIKHCLTCNNYSPFLDNANICPDCKPTEE